MAWLATCLLFVAEGCSTSALASSQPMLSNVRSARRILFLGDSITYGGGYVEDFEAVMRVRFPQWKGEILNLGLPSETVSGLSEPNHAGGEFPRPDLHERLERVLTQAKPDLVFACYGMNDGIYLPLDPERFGRFRSGMEKLHDRVKAAGAQIVHLTPPIYDPGVNANDPYDAVLGSYAEWLLSKRSSGWEVIDIHGPVLQELQARRRGNPSFTFARDHVHPDAFGHAAICRALLEGCGFASDEQYFPAEIAAGSHADWMRLLRTRQATLRDAWLTVTGHKRPGLPAGSPLETARVRARELDSQLRSDSPPLPTLWPAGGVDSWHGYTRHHFSVDGCPAWVAVPKQPRAGNPWAWCMEFPDAFTERCAGPALLSNGFYYAHIVVGNTFGSPVALSHFTAFHKALVNRGLSSRPALIGLSRGGLYAYRWASQNPRKVSVIYGDAPVCDFKSWPGGKGKGKGSPPDWTQLQGFYGFRNEAAALAYQGNPIDTLVPLARAKVPLIHVVGDTDEVVPAEENTGIIEARYRRLGGEIQVIHKPGIGHHPHGLEDPTPVVQFILSHTPGPR